MSQAQQKNALQLVWGCALVMMGIAVFFRTPQVIPRLVELNQSGATILFVRGCFYLIGIILIGGGARKLIQYFGASQAQPKDKPTGSNDTKG